MDFKDQVAIITGGSSGIGYGIAERLSIEGAKVYLVARTERKLAEAVDEIRKKGGRAEYRAADATVNGAIEKIIDDVYASEKRLDIFVNNAGVFKFTDINTDFKEVEEITNSDALAPGRIAQYLAHKFQDKGKIKILNTLSHAVFRPLPGNIGYGSAKEDLFRMVVQMKMDLKNKGITNIELLGIYPASVATPQLLELYKKGEVEAPTTLESVVDVAVELLSGKSPSMDAFVGYIPGKGILSAYYEVNFNTSYDNPNILKFLKEKIMDANYTPEKHFGI